MAGQSNSAPVIIKRKKIVKAGGHHGGAWKVAYADFVTAMMAFFMLMWLLNATTEKQRKGIADYFNPTIPLNRISGGGDGAFGGDSIFSEDTLLTTGTGGSQDHVAEQDKARGQTGTSEQDEKSAAAEKEALAEVAEALVAKTGESMTMERLMRHVVTRVSDMGLVIEIYDVPDSLLFAENSAEPEQVTKDIAALLAEVLALAKNGIAVDGYVRALPITLIHNPSWDLSAERAQVMRGLLEANGLDKKRISRITGHADRLPATADPTAIRNNRLEIILLRRDR